MILERRDPGEVLIRDKARCLRHSSSSDLNA